MINPLGFTLENFDAVGRFRDRGAGQADRRQRGATRPAPATWCKFAGVRDLAEFLADSDETHAAFVEQLFHHLVKQPVRAYGPQSARRAAKVVRTRTSSISASWRSSIVACRRHLDWPLTPASR